VAQLLVWNERYLDNFARCTPRALTALLQLVALGAQQPLPYLLEILTVLEFFSM